RVGGDDELAAPLVRDAVLGAEPVHPLAAVGAVAGLGRPGLVVQAGVDDAAVVAGLVAGEFALGLDHRDGGPGPGQRHPGRQPDDPAADDQHVRRFHRAPLRYATCLNRSASPHLATASARSAATSSRFSRGRSSPAVSTTAPYPVRTSTVRAPTAAPASRSLTRSPIIHDAAGSSPRSAAAARSIPGRGLRQSQSARYAATSASGWWGQK